MRDVGTGFVIFFSFFGVGGWYGFLLFWVFFIFVFFTDIFFIRDDITVGVEGGLGGGVVFRFVYL